MDLSDALAWAADRRTGVLITNRADGRSQSSDVSYAVDGEMIRVSITAERAKTVNMRRDTRVVFHITDPDAWSYVSLDSSVELSDVCAAPDDAAVEELVQLYRAVVGEHPDWQEFKNAMVDDRRLVARISPASATGQIHP